MGGASTDMTLRWATGEEAAQPPAPPASPPVDVFEALDSFARTGDTAPYVAAALVALVVFAAAALLALRIVRAPRESRGASCGIAAVCAVMLAAGIAAASCIVAREARAAEAGEPTLSVTAPLSLTAVYSPREDVVRIPDSAIENVGDVAVCLRSVGFSAAFGVSGAWTLSAALPGDSSPSTLARLMPAYDGSSCEPIAPAYIGAGEAATFSWSTDFSGEAAQSLIGSKLGTATYEFAAADLPLTGSIAVEGSPDVGETLTAVLSGVPDDADMGVTWTRATPALVDFGVTTIGPGDRVSRDVAVRTSGAKLVYELAFMPDTVFYVDVLEDGVLLTRKIHRYGGEGRFEVELDPGRYTIEARMARPSYSPIEVGCMFVEMPSETSVVARDSFTYTTTSDDVDCSFVAAARDVSGTYDGELASAPFGPIAGTPRVDAVATLYADGTLAFTRGEPASALADAHGAVVGQWAGFERNPYYATANVPWHAFRAQVASVEFVDAVAPFSTAFWFASMPNLARADVGKLDMSRATSIASMFKDCPGLVSLEGVASWDVSRVSNMGYAFFGCSSLPELDASGWSTSSLGAMQAMFSGCSSLASIEGIGTWDVDDVALFASVFAGCRSLSSLDVSAWNTAGATSTRMLFSGCESLESTGDLRGWDMSQVADASAMFSGCSRLASFGDISAWRVTALQRADQMFSGCAAMPSFDLGEWSTPSLTSCMAMFEGCASARFIDIAGFDTTGVKTVVSGPNSYTSGMTRFFGSSEPGSRLSSLTKVTLGALFDKAGDGVGVPDDIVSGDRIVSARALLPDQRDTVADASRRWYVVGADGTPQGDGFDPADLPDRTAAAYTCFAPSRPASSEAEADDAPGISGVADVSGGLDGGMGGEP